VLVVAAFVAAVAPPAEMTEVDIDDDDGDPRARLVMLV
jgi:hypothetical protein